MVLSRRPGRHLQNKLTPDNEPSEDELPGNHPKHCKRRCQRLQVATALLLWFTTQFLVGLSFRLSENLGIDSPKQLRGGSTDQPDTNSSCPALPLRIEKVRSFPPEPLTKLEMEYQMQNFMDANEFGTTGNKIFTCRHHKVRFCRGVVKIYRSKHMYYQVKRCLTLLHNAGITSRILYADDEIGLMVEEDMGKVSMMNSQIPLDDYVDQLQRIQCILQQHSIIHRDYNFRNFVVNQATGKIMIIDFGDAVVWQGGLWNPENYNLRNVENVSTIFYNVLAVPVV
jgi:hypothetical protein